MIMISIQPTYWIALRAMNESLRKLAEVGVEVEVTSDADMIARSVHEVRKDYISPLLDPQKNDFTDQNYFWIIAKKEGVPVAVGGGRLDCVADQLDQQLLSAFKRGYGENTLLSVSNSVIRELKGRVCYLGDLYIPNGRGLMKSVRPHFLVIANYISSQHFHADVTYSFMRQSDVFRGGADINGFTCRIQTPVVWGKLPSSRCNSELIVYRPKFEDCSYFRSFMPELERREAISTVNPSGP